ncbi:MAG: YdcF family protein [Solobacterium sp.]|nr:YdcF family protein [Solobacterium sp.]
MTLEKQNVPNKQLKKPKLWNIAGLSVFMLLVVWGLVLMKPPQYGLLINLILVLYFVIVLGLLFHTLIGQVRYNPYSYNTIFYIGFSTFLLFVIITQSSLTFHMVRQPEIYNQDQILYTLLRAAKDYMFYSAPLIFVLALALFVSNLFLLRKEKTVFVNVLGILLAIALVGGVVFLFFFDYAKAGSQQEVMWHDFMTNVFAVIYLYFECMMFGVIVVDYLAGRYEPAYNKDFLIILGCGIQPDGTPTPLLRDRIERAYQFYQKQMEQTGKKCLFITSGGQGKDEVIAESACMKNYLVQKGVPHTQILEENKSTSTYENMKFSKKIIDEVNPEGEIAFSTSNYHVFRSGINARYVKMKAFGMGAKTKWYFWPNAAVREFIGLISAHRLKQACILGGLVLLFTIMTYFAYLQ